MKENMNDLKKRVQCTDSEAWADSDHYIKESCVSIPSEDAVERQMEWLHTNER